MSGQRVIEASSGSTSIAFALACAQMGLRFVAVMPEGVSNERSLMIRAFGGEVIFTPKTEGIRGAISETERLAKEFGAFLPRQFANPDNAEAHRISTAREILDQIEGGTVDYVISGVGTGGTLVGLTWGLQESGCRVTPVLAKPVNITKNADVECCSFSQSIPGVVDSVSTIFKEANLEGLRTKEIQDAEALATTRLLHRCGFPVGPSSGLNYSAACAIARETPNTEKRIVTVFPDRMERYFTTELFTS
jgi:cysteine synthase A